mgnify:CR=1 FL=1
MLALSGVAHNAGHTLNRGGPREVFVAQFLKDNLAETVGFGTGEIVSADCQPRDSRNQIDLVIYDRRFPKIKLGGEVSAFLAESVVAAIEVKSLLTREALQTAMSSAKTIKGLPRIKKEIPIGGWIPPAILNYVVAFDGPASMDTVYGWVGEIGDELKLSYPTPFGSSMKEREQHASPAIDGIFVLGRGYVLLDNANFMASMDPNRAQHPNHRWIVNSQDRGAALTLFFLLAGAIGNSKFTIVDIDHYLSRHLVEGVRFGPPR